MKWRLAFLSVSMLLFVLLFLSSANYRQPGCCEEKVYLEDSLSRLNYALDLKTRLVDSLSKKLQRCGIAKDSIAELNKIPKSGSTWTKTIFCCTDMTHDHSCCEEKDLEKYRAQYGCKSFKRMRP